MKIENGYNSYLNAVRQSKDNIPTKNLSSKTEQVKKEDSVQVNISDTAKKNGSSKICRFKRYRYRSN